MNVLIFLYNGIADLVIVAKNCCTFGVKRERGMNNKSNYV